MRSVILFRHGKSDWDADYGSDHDRPLAQKGVNAAKKMGKYLAGLDQIPDVVLSSTAVRARTTVELAMAAGSWGSRYRLEGDIYGGSPKVLLSLLQNLSSDDHIACLVGHEPIFSSFISMSTHSGGVQFPTASMARIDFNVQQWQEVRLGGGALAWLMRPKELD
ncbi:MAG: hypothetical protein COB66_06830 [Coxiella sp. (in: Bacteria)]|nr:MAG: hypothetical protein COB66_06830 [Coxiella sp. (in: g-proteobacteria)]